MAGDPIYDSTTSVFHKEQIWYDTSTPYRYSVKSTVRVDYDEIERQKKLKELLRKQIIKEMKDTWSEFQLLIKPPTLKPTIQLRGVCFGGRGWA